MRFIFITLLIFFLSTSLVGQFSFKVAYNYAYTNPKVHNSIIDQLNANNSLTLTEYVPMEGINPWHGVDLGLRYKFGPIGIFTTWNPLFQLRRLKGENSAGNEVTRKHFYRLDAYSAGLELFFGDNISVGGSYGYNYMRIRAEITERSDRHVIFEDNGWGSQFFVSLNAYGNEALNIGLQPYVNIPWTKFNYQQLETELGTDTGITDFEESFITYGIRLVFQNGPAN